LAARRAGALYFLTTLDQSQPYIIVTTISAAMQNVPPRSIISDAGLTAKVGEDMERERIIRYLTNNGYSRASTVVEAGDFAARGGIVDIFPPTEKNPLRISLAMKLRVSESSTWTANGQRLRGPS
jgi:transcription-repair coupling factor (superfamily II helicase)